MINDPFTGVDLKAIADDLSQFEYGQAATDKANPGAALAELIASNIDGATRYLRTLSTARLSNVMGAGQVLSDLAEQLYDERMDAELAAEEARNRPGDDDVDVDHEPLRCELDYQDGVCLAPLNAGSCTRRGGFHDSTGMWLPPAEASR